MIESLTRFDIYLDHFRTFGAIEHIIGLLDH